MCGKRHKAKDGGKKKIKKVDREADYFSDIKMNTCEMPIKNSNMDCKCVCTQQNREEMYTQQMKRSDQRQRHQTEAESRKEGVRDFINSFGKNRFSI